MGVHSIASEEEFEIIKQENKFIVLDAFATWCGPCKMIAPTLVKWSNTELKDRVFFAKFDVDALPKLAQELGVRAMPTFIFFKDGEKDGEFTGANAPGLLDLIKKKVADLVPAAPEATPETAPAAAPEE
jgi:thioredoxin 1